MTLKPLGRWLRKLAHPVSHHKGVASQDTDKDPIANAAGSSSPKNEREHILKPIPVSKGVDKAAYSFQEITIISQMLWSPTFFEWSSKFLSRSPAITHVTLSLDHDVRSWGPDIKGCGPGGWLTNFRTIVFPALTNFTYWSQIDLGEKPTRSIYKAVADFLRRHPTIETVTIQRCHALGTAFSDLIQVNGPILPHLKSLQAHPALVQWIIQMKRHSFETLKDIEMDLTGHTGPLDVYDLLDQCLLTLLQHHLNCSDVHLHFIFPSISHPFDWFRSHIEATEERVHLLSSRNSRDNRRPQIERFTGTRFIKVFAAHDKTPAFPLPEPWYQAEVLARWIGLFPDVEDIYVSAIPWSIPDDPAEMAEVDRAFNFRVHCPRAKKVMMGHIPLVEAYTS